VPSVGELWLTSPATRKLYDIHDVAVSIASNSANGDITADLVDVGAGRAQDLEGKDLKGKVAIGSSGVGRFTPPPSSAPSARSVIAVCAPTIIPIRSRPQDWAQPPPVSAGGRAARGTNSSYAVAQPKVTIRSIVARSACREMEVVTRRSPAIRRRRRTMVSAHL
jgi:hypothetical protein